MMLTLETGMIIKTKYGKAKVLRTSRDGVYVEMQSGPMQGKNMKISISLIEEMDSSNNKPNDIPILIKDENSNISTSKEVNKNFDVCIPKEADESSDLLKKYKCIDALRFGLVPHEYIEELTLGYSNIKNSISTSFPEITDKIPQKIHQVTGQFGEGKTHTMSVIRYLAKKEGYLVGRIEVDGKRITLADPKMLLYTIMNSLEGNELSKVRPLLNLYLKSINNGYKHPNISSKKDIQRVNTIYQMIELLNRYNYIESLDHILYDVLICSDDRTAIEAKTEICTQTKERLSTYDINNVGIYPMIGRLLDERPHDFIESLIGTTLVAQQAGYKGFIITIDEYEVEETLSSGRQNERKAKMLLNLLHKYFSGKSSFPNVPFAIYIATVPSSGGGMDEKISIDNLMEASGGTNFQLEPYIGWNSKDIDQINLVEKVHSLYIDIYNCNPLPKKQFFAAIDRQMVDLDVYESGGIRSFMKRYIGFLDSEYGPPSLNS